MPFLVRIVLAVKVLVFLVGLFVSLGGLVFGRSGCYLALTWSAPRPLAGYYRTGHKKLATPHPPRLTPFKGSSEAFRADRAGLAQGLRQLDVCR